jgi:hypothetical protein
LGISRILRVGRRRRTRGSGEQRVVWAVVVGAIAIFGILAAALLRSGVFDQNTSKYNPKIVVGVLTLLGGVIASSFTFVGVLLKHSIDTHSARLAEETEARLRLETSIKAVELLTMEDGTPAPSIRQAGALFVLGSHPLRQLDLALALLRENWKRPDGVSSSAAVWLINEVLEHGDSAAQEIEAASILAANTALLVQPDASGIEWPPCAGQDRWPTEIAFDARAFLLLAAIRTLTERAAHEWAPGVVNEFISQLDVIRRRDPRPAIKYAAVLALEAALEWLERKWPDSSFTIFTEDGELQLATLRQKITPQLDTARREAPAEHIAAVDELRMKWGLAEPQLTP